MYGDLGSIGLVGTRGKLGQFIDLPDNAEVIALFNQGLAHMFGFNWVEASRNFKVHLFVLFQAYYLLVYFGSLRDYTEC